MKIALSMAVILILTGCTNTQDGIPDECSLPSGVTVTSMALDESQAGEISGTGETGFSVSVELSRSLNDGELAIVCYALRDSEIIKGMPLAGGFVGMTSADGTSATREGSFNLTCEDGKIAGRATIAMDDLVALNRSSKERSTKIFVQHLEGMKTFVGLTVGMSGTTSNRIRVSCPR